MSMMIRRIHYLLLKGLTVDRKRNIRIMVLMIIKEQFPNAVKLLGQSFGGVGRTAFKELSLFSTNTPCRMHVTNIWWFQPITVNNYSNHQQRLILLLFQWFYCDILLVDCMTLYQNVSQSSFTHKQTEQYKHFNTCR